jgi:Trypsin-like peptidase domain/Colicin V production protein
VTTVDWIIVAFTLVMALWGWAQGLVVGAMSLAGFTAGGFLGSRLAPLLLHGGSSSPYAPLITLVAAVTLGGVLATLLETLGFGLRRRMGPTLGRLDGVGGAVLVACFGLGLVWVAGAVALQTPGARELRRDIQRSTILQALNDALPPSGPILNALARFDPLPSVNGPDADVPAPDSRVARDPQVRAAGRSVVRVLGTACGLGVQGSGWVAGDGIVVTNAHVVAGEDDTTVQAEGQGPHLSATAIWFDSRNDIALLRVRGLSGIRPLSLRGDASTGTTAAVLGFPHNGPYDVEPARLGPTTTALSDDAYGRGPVRRAISAFRGLVRSGNSGGPVVDSAGRVVATVFAASIGGPRRTGFGVPDSIVSGALSRARGAVDTGPCAR